MSKMLRLELVGLVLLACTQILTEHRDFSESRTPYGHRHRYQDDRMTKEVHVKQGRLRGMVVQPKTNHNLQLVDVFLGVPYADPPIGSGRFTPPRSPQSWRGVRQAQDFAPVCPQVLPNVDDAVKPVRYNYLVRHLAYLRNQSEDCLYLNIYAPHQAEGQKAMRKYPVMVFIHGESFEWNSGNPYDGTILASYGNVVFVTINYRLGILGFLRPGIREDTPSNFGLLDQIAALLWLRENVAVFGGDPKSVTLVGHGTGAIFANLLLISPVANNKGLFKRAILMSGSALSADAIGKAPLQITKQVAHALNCPTTDDNRLALCLQRQDVDALLNVKIHKPKYVPAYAPLIDRAVIPDKPLNLMENAQLFGSFDLMYGVTQLEKFYILPPVALLHGIFDNQRDDVLREHAKATYELEPEFILMKTLARYEDFANGYSNEYTKKNRDMVLEVLSDSGTVAPLIMAADLHSRANPKSYMYVFSHPKAMQDYPGQQQQRTVHGEDLPYVLGVPLDVSKYDAHERYNIGETLFSEAVMNWWCSFAYIGNPNVAKRSFLTDGSKEWERYNVDWPEYDPVNQTYFNLTIPPALGSRYRAAEMQFWNEDLPDMLRHPNKDIPPATRPKGPRPEILDKADGVGKYANDSFSRNYEIYGARYTTQNPSSITDTTGDKLPFPFATTTSQSDTESTTPDSASIRSPSAISMVIGFGVVFLLINVTAFLYLYRKRHGAKAKEKSLKRRLSQKEDAAKKPKTDKHENHYGELGYKSDSKPDLNDVIKNDKAYDNNSNFGRRSKLSRQNSSSTIETHIKVREWIQQEIVHRCSPRFLRKTRETLQKEHQEKLTKQQEEEKKRLEAEMLKEKSTEPIYDESPALIVRPGKKSKLPKVSVAIDATPATRTESVLNQVPIELAKDSEPTDEQYAATYDFPVQERGQLRVAPQVVVIEHHHSRSDPLPMENVLKSVKPNFSTPRIYESDSGSTSSLYAKINPKMKSRLPRAPAVTIPDSSTTSNANANDDRTTPVEEIYVKTGPKLTTFGAGVAPHCDVNVTCREPTVERECASPEEALRTIKRRNYPKVLPDIEKRRSLPAPSALFMPKHQGNSLKDYKSGCQANASSGQPPLPPPRMFGPSKSLEFAEESESQCDREPITTNLHVGPLSRRPDASMKNNSDPSIIDSCEASMGTSVQTGGSVDTIYSNPKCPLHGAGFPFAPTSQSVEHDIGGPAILLEAGMGNPNWYRPGPCERGKPQVIASSSEPRIVITAREPERQLQLGGGNPNWDSRAPGAEPRIVITPRVGNLLGQASQGLNHAAANLPAVRLDEPSEREHRFAYGATRVGPVTGSSERLEPGSLVRTPIEACSLAEPQAFVERREPRIIVTPRDAKGCAGSGLKQPKIIIKPTSSLQRSRDQRHIPKVSAIPSPEKANGQYADRDKSSEQRDGKPGSEKPPLREKPKVTRIPSFSRRRDEPAASGEKPSVPQYLERTEIVQRVEAVPGMVASAPLHGEIKPGVPVLQKESEKSSSTDSSSASTGNSNNSNTGTVKRKPPSKK